VNPVSSDAELLRHFWKLTLLPRTEQQQYLSKLRQHSPDLFELLEKRFSTEWSRCQREDEVAIADAVRAAALDPHGVIEREVGGHRIKAILGRGGMATVYRAEEIATGKIVALKMLDVAGVETVPTAGAAKHGHTDSPGAHRKANLIEQFRREFNALNCLDSAHTPRAYQLSADGEHGPFFTFELIEGMPISDYCRSRELGPRDIAQLMLPVVRLVQQLAKRGVIHADITPKNIVVREARGVREAVLIDFGLVYFSGAKFISQSLAETFVERYATREFAPPEQLLDEPVPEKSDVFSVAATLMFLAFGRTVRSGSRPLTQSFATTSGGSSTAERHSGMNQRLREWANTVRLPPPDGGELAALITQALAVDPQERPSPAELCERLRRFADGEAPPQETVPAQVRKRTWRTVVLVSCAVLIVMVASRVWEFPGRQRGDRSAVLSTATEAAVVSPEAAQSEGRDWLARLDPTEMSRKPSLMRERFQVLAVRPWSVRREALEQVLAGPQFAEGLLEFWQEFAQCLVGADSQVRDEITQDLLKCLAPSSGRCDAAQLLAAIVLTELDVTAPAIADALLRATERDLPQQMRSIVAVCLIVQSGALSPVQRREFAPEVVRAQCRWTTFEEFRVLLAGEDSIERSAVRADLMRSLSSLDSLHVGLLALDALETWPEEQSANHAEFTPDELLQLCLHSPRGSGLHRDSTPTDPFDSPISLPLPIPQRREAAPVDMGSEYALHVARHPDATNAQRLEALRHLLRRGEGVRPSPGYEATIGALIAFLPEPSLPMLLRECIDGGGLSPQFNRLFIDKLEYRFRSIWPQSAVDSLAAVAVAGIVTPPDRDDGVFGEVFVGGTYPGAEHGFFSAPRTDLESIADFLLGLPGDLSQPVEHASQALVDRLVQRGPLTSARFEDLRTLKHLLSPEDAQWERVEESIAASVSEFPDNQRGPQFAFSLTVEAARLLPGTWRSKVVASLKTIADSDAAWWERWPAVRAVAELSPQGAEAVDALIQELIELDELGSKPVELSLQVPREQFMASSSKAAAGENSPLSVDTDSRRVAIIDLAPFASPSARRELAYTIAQRIRFPADSYELTRRCAFLSAVVVEADDVPASLKVEWAGWICEQLDANSGIWIADEWKVLVPEVGPERDRIRLALSTAIARANEPEALFALTPTIGVLTSPGDPVRRTALACALELVDKEDRRGSGFRGGELWLRGIAELRLVLQPGWPDVEASMFLCKLGNADLPSEPLVEMFLQSDPTIDELLLALRHPTLAGSCRRALLLALQQRLALAAPTANRWELLALAAENADLSDRSYWALGAAHRDE